MFFLRYHNNSACTAVRLGGGPKRFGLQFFYKNCPCVATGTYSSVQHQSCLTYNCKIFMHIRRCCQLFLPSNHSSSPPLSPRLSLSVFLLMHFHLKALFGYQGINPLVDPISAWIGLTPILSPNPSRYSSHLAWICSTRGG